MNIQSRRPTNAFVGVSWVALVVGVLTFLFGLWNANLQLNEKGYYLTVLLYGLFSAVSLQKSVRDQAEGIPVTAMYFALCWVSVVAAVLLMIVGMWNATLVASEKGFMPWLFCLAYLPLLLYKKIYVI